MLSARGDPDILFPSPPPIPQPMDTETLTIQHDGEEYEFQVDVTPGGKRIHIYVKEVWWGVPTDASIEAYSDSLRYHAERLDALAANGWELTDSDGEHLYFQKSDDDSTEAKPGEVTGDLE